MLYCRQVSPKISLTLDHAPVGDVLQAMAEQQQRNIALAPDIDGTVTLNLHDVPWQQAFSMILKLTKLIAVKSGDILHIQRQASLAEQQAQQAETHKRHLKEQPLIHQVYTPRYAEVDVLGAALNASGETLLGPRNHITIDTRANRLLIYDHREAQQKIARWIADMDIPLAQIEIAAHIVTINRDALRELGIKWSNKKREEAAGSGLAHVTSHLNLGPAAAGFNMGRIGGQMLEIELSALEHQQRLAIIASPRLLVAHQQSATIKQGTEIPYQTGNSQRTANAIAFKEAVLGMEVTPFVNLQSEIRLKLRITQNMPGRTLQHAGGEALAIDKQEIETQVVVQNGETLVLGGIFQQQRHLDGRRVPFLADIPWLGALFRQQNDKNQRRELVVFITPRLLTSS